MLGVWMIGRHGLATRALMLCVYVLLMMGLDTLFLRQADTRRIIELRLPSEEFNNSHQWTFLAS